SDEPNNSVMRGYAGLFVKDQRTNVVSRTKAFRLARGAIRRFSLHFGEEIPTLGSFTGRPGSSLRAIALLMKERCLSESRQVLDYWNNHHRQGELMAKRRGNRN